MAENVQSVLMFLVLTSLCVCASWLLKTRKQQIRTIATDLIQKAEETVSGSGMGAEKKQKVIAQLEAMGITVDDWLDKEIDNIVATLNEKSGWLVAKAFDSAKEAIDAALGA